MKSNLSTIRRARAICSVVTLWLVLNTSRAVAQFENWNETRRASEQFQAVTFGANRFVAVGDDAVVVTSPDGRNWTRRAVTLSGANPHLNGVAYGVTHGVGKFVAVGQFTGRIIHSTDGVQWSLASASQASIMKAVAFGGGYFVAVGTGGQIYSSTDATNWAKVYGSGGNFEGIAYGNGRFIAAYTSGATVVGDGGPNWPAGSSAVLNTTARAVAFGGGRFVLADSNGHSLVTTNGGINPQTGGFAGKAYAATYAQDCFVLAGVYNMRSYIAYSTDGMNWVERPQPGPFFDWAFTLKGIAFGNGTLVAVGENTSYDNGQILTHDLPKPPEVIRVPENRAVVNGMGVSFTVETWKTSAETYQWFLNGQPLSGATNQILIVPNVQPVNTGRYTVRVTNPLGSVTTTTGGLLLSYETKRHAGLTISNTVGSNVQIEYRDTLQDGWMGLTNLVLPQSPYLFLESEAVTAHPQRYFRTASFNGSSTHLSIALYNGFDFWGLPGATYLVEYRDTLSNSWNNLTNLTLTGFPHSWFDKSSGNRPNREYRFTPAFE